MPTVSSGHSRVKPSRGIRETVEAHRAGDHVRAEKLARTLHETCGSLPPIPEILGLALLALGGSGEAKPFLREAAVSDSHSSTPCFALGVVLADRGAWTEAAGRFWEALRLRSDFPEGRFNLAYALEELGETSGPGRPVRISSRRIPISWMLRLTTRHSSRSATNPER